MKKTLTLGPKNPKTKGGNGGPRPHPPAPRPGPKSG